MCPGQRQSGAAQLLPKSVVAGLAAVALTLETAWKPLLPARVVNCFAAGLDKLRIVVLAPGVHSDLRWYGGQRSQGNSAAPPRMLALCIAHPLLPRAPRWRRLGLQKVPVLWCHPQICISLFLLIRRPTSPLFLRSWALQQREASCEPQAGKGACRSTFLTTKAV